jgi:pimeloyl-ACP methyl ester carboxylesterase
MPTIKNGDATIYYEVHGKGFPILTFAPAGLQSKISVWSEASAPINPITEWSGSYSVIVMDQRNAAGGQSRAAIKASDGWDTYTSDHLAVLDHLKVEKCHLYGQCIGGSFIANLIKKAPQRVQSAVWAQPIGRVGEMKPGRAVRFNEWAASLKDHPEATEQVLDSFHSNLYGAGFLYAVDREFVKNCRTPSVVLAGNDEAHPRPISDETAKLLPNCEEYILEWKQGAPLEAAKKAVKAFFAKHTPGGLAKAA